MKRSLLGLTVYFICVSIGGLAVATAAPMTCHELFSSARNAFSSTDSTSTLIKAHVLASQLSAGALEVSSVDLAALRALVENEVDSVLKDAGVFLSENEAKLLGPGHDALVTIGATHDEALKQMEALERTLRPGFLRKLVLPKKTLAKRKMRLTDQLRECRISAQACANAVQEYSRSLEETKTEALFLARSAREQAAIFSEAAKVVARDGRLTHAVSGEIAAELSQHANDLASVSQSLDGFAETTLLMQRKASVELEAIEETQLSGIEALVAQGVSETVLIPSGYRPDFKLTEIMASHRSTDEIHDGLRQYLRAKKAITDADLLYIIEHLPVARRNLSLSRAGSGILTDLAISFGFWGGWWKKLNSTTEGQLINEAFGKTKVRFLKNSDLVGIRRQAIRLLAQVARAEFISTGEKSLRQIEDEISQYVSIFEGLPLRDSEPNVHR